MDERGDEIAAVITEPAMFNTGCILPEPGYLELLREETRKHGALLIFDEVITGFRFCRGGAQEWFGVMPDLTTMAKGLGGGFPVAAIGGTREVMGMIADGRYSHSGTYNANVVQCAAVSATMDVLAEPGLYERQRALGERLAQGLRELAAEPAFRSRSRGSAPSSSSGSASTPSRTGARPTPTPTRRASPAGGRRCCCAACIFHPSQFENLFVSLVHTDARRRRDAGGGGRGLSRPRGRGARDEEASMGAA